MELLVVVIILGILAAMGVPYYLKTVEVSKADNAAAIGHMIASAYRIYLVENPGAELSGELTDSCSGRVCAASSAPDPCRLVACNYVARQNWESAAYTYTIGGGNSIAAAAKRKSGDLPGTNDSDYTGWGYEFDTSGGCRNLGGAPDCPGF
jgi:type II secretory pathway pseudopilin PulG